MSYGIPPASSMFDIAKELAIESSKKKIPGIMKKIRQAAFRQETEVGIGKFSWLEVDNLIYIFQSKGYLARHGSGSWGRIGLIINWGQK